MTTFVHDGYRGDIIYSLPAIRKLGGGHLFLKGFEDMAEIVAHQHYIEGVTQYQGEDADFDFRPYALDMRVKNLHLSRTQWVVLGGESHLDLSKPWIEVPYSESAEIVVQVSDRWASYNTDWSILKPFKDRIAYVGWEFEYHKFGMIQRFIPCSSVMDFAGKIRSAKLFIGNQSLGFALAEAMKIPRILAEHPTWKNCKPQSSNGHIGLRRKTIELYIS